MCNNIERLKASGTGGTKRDKREILKLDRSGTHGTTTPKGLPRVPMPRDVERALALLKAEVLTYCNAYISRGIHAEGAALARLRKAAER